MGSLTWIMLIKGNFDRQAQLYGWSEQKLASEHRLVDATGEIMKAKCDEEDLERQALISSVLQIEIWQPILDQLQNLSAVWLVTDGLGSDAREGRLFYERSYGNAYYSSVCSQGKGGHWVSRDNHNHSRYLRATLFGFLEIFNQVAKQTITEFHFGDITWGYGLHFPPRCSHLDQWRSLLLTVEVLSLVFTKARCAGSAAITSEHIELSLSRNITQQIVAQTGAGLKKLTIGWDHDIFQLPVPCDAIASMDFPQLELFSTSGFSFQLDIFQQFLSRHAGTLKQLEINDFTLLPSDCKYSATLVLGDFYCWITENTSLYDARFSGVCQVGNDSVDRFSMDRECPWLILHQRDVGAIRHQRSPIGLQIGLVVSSRRPLVHLTANFGGWDHTPRRDRVQWIRALTALEFRGSSMECT